MVDKRVPIHYQSTYLHWDLAAKFYLNYFEGNATKYVSRWRKKGGIEDLKKALHYLDKLMEIGKTYTFRSTPKSEVGYEVHKFAIANDLTVTEEEFVLLLCTYENSFDLHNARCILEDIIEEAELGLIGRPEPNFPGTPEDGGHHAET